MAIETLATPGAVTDLDATTAREWSGLVSEMLNAARRGHPQFFNPLKKNPGTSATTKVMRWGAFSRKLSRHPAPKKWMLGEDRNAQEEYCEWVAARHTDGRIQRVIFTSEVPEYYRFLARRARPTLVALYKQHVSPNVREADLFTGTQYNAANRWNVAGAMHMIQGQNTLEAAVTLVAQATVQREHNAVPITNANALITCGVAADRQRNSDPLIVTDVNQLARSKANVSLADPIGLYIDRLRTVGWTTPDGSDPAKFWKVTRGAAGFAVRAIYEVPATKQFTVSDILINGAPINSPSQIAEFVDVRVEGIAFGRSNARPQPCRGASLAAASTQTALTLADITAGSQARG